MRWRAVGSGCGPCRSALEARLGPALKGAVDVLHVRADQGAELGIKLDAALLGIEEDADQPQRLLFEHRRPRRADHAGLHDETVHLLGLAATARQASLSGAPLPSWSGCRRLGPNDIFLLGQADGSFDGRYFGITGADEIVVPLALLLPIGVGRSRK